MGVGGTCPDTLNFGLRRILRALKYSQQISLYTCSVLFKAELQANEAQVVFIQDKNNIWLVLIQMFFKEKEQ